MINKLKFKPTFHSCSHGSLILTGSLLILLPDQAAGASGKSKKASAQASARAGDPSTDWPHRAASSRSQPLNLSQVKADGQRRSRCQEVQLNAEDSGRRGGKRKVFYQTNQFTDSTNRLPEKTNWLCLKATFKIE